MRKSWENHEKEIRKSWESHEKVKRKSWESQWTVMRISWEIHEKVARKLLESCQKVARKFPENCQKIARKFPKGCQKVARKSFDSHETVYYSTPVADLADTSVLVCSVRGLSVSHLPTGWPHDHGLPFRQKPWQKNSFSKEPSNINYFQNFRNIRGQIFWPSHKQREKTFKAG